MIEGIETLDLAIQRIHSWNEKEYLRIGVLPEDARGPNGVISLLIVQFSIDKQSTCTALQACLSTDEIDQVIAGLQEAKKRKEAL